MDGKHEETLLGRNSRILQFLMHQIFELVSAGQPISQELAELTMMCADTMRDQIVRLGA